MDQNIFDFKQPTDNNQNILPFPDQPEKGLGIEDEQRVAELVSLVNDHQQETRVTSFEQQPILYKADRFSSSRFQKASGTLFQLSKLIRTNQLVAQAWLDNNCQKINSSFAIFAGALMTYISQQNIGQPMELGDLDPRFAIGLGIATIGGGVVSFAVSAYREHKADKTVAIDGELFVRVVRQQKSVDYIPHDEYYGLEDTNNKIR